MRCLRREGGPVDLRTPWRRARTGKLRNVREQWRNVGASCREPKVRETISELSIHHPVPPDRAVPVFRVLFSAVLPGMFLSQIARGRDYGFTLINEDSISEAVTMG